MRRTFSTRRLRYCHHGERMYRVRGSNETSRAEGQEAGRNKCRGRLRHADAVNSSGRATCKYLQLGDGATGGAMLLRLPSEWYVRRAAVKLMLGNAAGVREVKDRCGRKLAPRSRRESLLLSKRGATGVKRAKNSCRKEPQIRRSGLAQDDAQ
jgi:hypothetical protein